MVVVVCIGQGGDGHGNKSFIDTVDSQPSGYRMCAYAGFTLVNSTSSTRGSFLLLRTNRLSITSPGADNQVGKEDPQGTVESKDLIECSIFGSTISH